MAGWWRCVTARRLSRRRLLWRGLFTDPALLMALWYCLISSLMPATRWINVWAPARLAAPGIIFGIFSVCRLDRPLRVVYALSLIRTAAFLAVVA